MSGLTDGDRQWLEGKFTDVHRKIEDRDSRVNHLKTEVELLKAGSPHKCAEEIAKHEAGAWSHNPKKALSLAALIVGIVEGIRKFLHG